MASRDDVAEKMGISPWTVSRAFNGSSMPEARREEILRVAANLGYQPIKWGNRKGSYDYYRPVIDKPTTEKECEAVKWFRGFDTKQKLELITLLFGYWHEQQQAVLEVMRGD